MQPHGTTYNLMCCSHVSSVSLEVDLFKLSLVKKIMFLILVRGVLAVKTSLGRFRQRRRGHDGLEIYSGHQRLVQNLNADFEGFL